LLDMTIKRSDRRLTRRVTGPDHSSHRDRFCK
jgi:hypothetical protein